MLFWSKEWLMGIMMSEYNHDNTCSFSNLRMARHKLANSTQIIVEVEKMSSPDLTFSLEKMASRIGSLMLKIISALVCCFKNIFALV